MSASATRQRLTVRAGDARVAMAAEAVAEVVRGARLTRVPHAPDGVVGVVHLRGQVLPVVSLSSLLGGAARPVDRLVVMRRDPPLALAVEGVETLKALAADDAHSAESRLLLDEGEGARWFDLDQALNQRFAVFRTRRRGAAAPARPASAETAAASDRAYLTFQLAGQAYAMPLTAVREVAEAPRELASLPRTEDVLLGVCERRGLLLPVVTLRGLLGLPAAAASGAERLIVTQVGGHDLGLIVDEVSAILRAPDERLGPAPTLFNRGAGEARIDSVLRLADGRGLVSVLSPHTLLADERVARLLEAAGDSKDSSMAQIVETAAQAPRARRFVVLRLGEERYGLPIEAVDEVVSAPETLSRLPRAPAYVRGVMNLRGRVVPVIDQRQRFSVSGQAAGAGRIVVVTMGELQAGFAVDGVDSILEVGAKALLPAPDIADEGAAVFDQAIERDGEVVLLIDPKALLDRAEADLLRDLTAGAAGS